MAPRKRLRPKGESAPVKAQKPASEPAQEPEEPKTSTEFAEGLEEYRKIEEELKALEASIAEQKVALTERRDAVKSHLTEIVEAAGVKKMEGAGGMVTLVRPTRHEVDEELLQKRLAAKTWKAITETTTRLVQKKFEEAIVDGLIAPELYQEAVKEVPASKGHTKVTIAKPKAPSEER